MLIRKIIITLTSFNFCFLLSQSTKCDCISNLDTLIVKTEKNYAGFPKKALENNQTKYIALKNSTRAKAKQIKEAKPCFYVMSEYVQFFYDRHFAVTYYNEQDFDIEQINISEEELINQLKHRKKNDLEGIWVNQNNKLKIGILKFPNDIYKAFILESNDTKISKGQIYMKISKGKKGLDVKYYDSFSSTIYPIKQKGNLLLGWNGEIFGKIYPNAMSKNEVKEFNTWKYGNNGLDFYTISNKTAVLKIPTFGNNDEKIAELVQKNDKTIRSTENLIVDLTGNGGGSTGWVSFLDYFLTQPIVQDNGYVRISPENIKLKMADISPFVTNPIPNEYEKYFPESTKQIYKKAYQELPVTQNEFYPVPGVVFPLDSITRYPKKIALVVDHLCASSSEYFFYLSKKSGKTKSYGVNTYGMMDYEGASSFALPYSNFRVSIPIVKSSWTDQNPIDTTGFTPDYILDKIKQEDWIEYIRKKIEN